jgi:dolichol-phosphate mannosyltransferase
MFTPVIYWNATHDWVSFLFQSKRRFAATSTIDLPYLVGLVLFFITPLGAFGLWRLMKKDTTNIIKVEVNSKRFIRIFTLVPLGFFSLFSLNHEINLNWIGPLFLAMIPWLVSQIKHIPNQRKAWFGVAYGLLACYSGILGLAVFNTSELVQQKLFIKAIAWESLVNDFHHLAQQIESKSGKPVVFAPLDNFPIGSELSFYQAKLLSQGKISKIYPVIGSHIFGVESLMYRYWSNNEGLKGANVILISKELWRFDLPELTKLTMAQSDLNSMWSTGQGQKVRNIPFYYKVGLIK